MGQDWNSIPCGDFHRRKPFTLLVVGSGLAIDKERKQDGERVEKILKLTSQYQLLPSVDNTLSCFEVIQQVTLRFKPTSFFCDLLTTTWTLCQCSQFALASPPHSPKTCRLDCNPKLPQVNVNVSVNGCLPLYVYMWWTGNLSRVYPASGLSSGHLRHS